MAFSWYLLAHEITTGPGGPVVEECGQATQAGVVAVGRKGSGNHDFLQKILAGANEWILYGELAGNANQHGHQVDGRLPIGLVFAHHALPFDSAANAASAARQMASGAVAPSDSNVFPIVYGCRSKQTRHAISLALAVAPS